MIYGQEEGFDKNFGNGGMWGNAVYFAVNASYSHSDYTFKNTAEGCK